jgi:hypothetical protein
VLRGVCGFLWFMSFNGGSPATEMLIRSPAVGGGSRWKYPWLKLKTNVVQRLGNSLPLSGPSQRNHPEAQPDGKPPWISISCSFANREKNLRHAGASRHPRPPHRLRLNVVALVRRHVWLHILRRHEPHLMTLFSQLESLVCSHQGWTDPCSVLALWFDEGSPRLPQSGEVSGRLTLTMKPMPRLWAQYTQPSSHNAHCGDMPGRHLMGEYCQLLTRLREYGNSESELKSFVIAPAPLIEYLR